MSIGQDDAKMDADGARDQSAATWDANQSRKELGNQGCVCVKERNSKGRQGEKEKENMES